MYREITIREALTLEDGFFVDVRSESEYAEATIPGAINIPILHDEERALVGATYRHQGPDRARRQGLLLVSPKLPQKVAALDIASGGRKPVLFCWRGGDRSKSMAAVLDAMGYQTYRVIGGYKAYRRYINEYLAHDTIPHRAVVLHGLTGIGKTEVLQRLSDEGIPALDLEGLAHHRGSAFGRIGQQPAPSQKMFEAMVVHVLSRYEKKGVIVMECESKRVGNLFVPPPVMASMTRGYRVLLYTSMENRVERINRVYTDGPGRNIAELQRSVSSLGRKLGYRRVAELNHLLEEKEFDQVVSFLLKDYYDPLYRYPDAPSDDYDLSVDTSDIESAALTVKKFVMELPEYERPDFKGCS